MELLEEVVIGGMLGGTGEGSVTRIINGTV